MKRDAAELLKEALALPPEARAALVGLLLDSLDTDVDEDAEAAWETEVNRRVADLDAGVVQMIPWPEVRRRLFERARHRALRRLEEGMDLQWIPSASRDDVHDRES
jgi:putative addiction module component (TIGR02574 family)